MTTISQAKPRPHSLSWTSAIGDFVRTLMAWQDRARGRRQLLSLSDRALKDIGRSRDDVASSMPRPVWMMGESDQPHWRARIACRPEPSITSEESPSGEHVRLAHCFGLSVTVRDV
jgi:uncharacterized protein YjiS (DUF1127 family)